MFCIWMKHLSTSKKKHSLVTSVLHIWSGKREDSMPICTLFSRGTTFSTGVRSTTTAWTVTLYMHPWPTPFTGFEKPCLDWEHSPLLKRIIYPISCGKDLPTLCLVVFYYHNLHLRTGQVNFWDCQWNVQLLEEIGLSQRFWPDYIPATLH